MSTPDISQETLLTSFRKYLKPIMFAMLILGFASGLPLMMVFSKLSNWLRESGIDRATIGGLYAVSFAYSLKFLWAPAVDRLPLPVLKSLLGHRKSWMLLALAGTIIGLLIIATSDPQTRLLHTVIGALILAFSGATLDVSVDAWRIESAPNDEQANMAAVYILGYRFAIMFAGFGILIAGMASWFAAYVTMAVAMAMIAVFMIIFVKEPERIERDMSGMSFAEKLGRSIVEPFWQFVKSYGVWVIPVFGIVALYRMSDFTMGVMAQPFYVDLGYSKETVGLIQGTFGPWPLVVGGFLGGFVAVRYKLMPALLFGALLTLVTNGAFAGLALAAGPHLDTVARAVETGAVIPDGVAVVTPGNWALLGVIVCDNLAAGFVGAVFIAYLSSLVDREYSATQYALLSSAYSFFCKLAATASGAVSEMTGWAGFFLLTASYAIPPFILILVIMRFGPDHAKGVRLELK